MIEKILEYKGQNVYYKIEGDGYPLLFLHGWGVDSNYFKDLKWELGCRFAYVSVDWPGFGKSLPLARPWSLGDYAEFLRYLVEVELNLNKYSIIAHSFGGGVALKTVGEGMIKPDVMILAGSAGIRRESVKSRAFKWIARIGKKFFQATHLYCLEDFAKRILYFFAGSHDYLKSQKYDNLKETFTQVVSEDLQVILPKVSVPVLLLWGNKDFYTPLWHGDLMRKFLPDSRLHIIDDGDHAILRKNTALCASLICAFLREKKII